MTKRRIFIGVILAVVLVRVWVAVMPGTPERLPGVPVVVAPSGN